MSTMTFSSPLMSCFPLQATTPKALDGYYRSKLFISPASNNPLMAAAGPLLSLLERLGTTPSLPPIKDIRSNIEHELQAFRSYLASKNYAEEFTTIALYLLTSTTDELLGKNHLRLHGKPAKFKAFTPLSLNKKGPQVMFFEILEQLKEKANQYLDLIELAYYCLITGFEGELHIQADGRQKLDNLIEELYQLISKHRVNKPLQLFSENPHQRLAGDTNTAPKTSKKTVIAATLLTISMITAALSLSQLLIQHKATMIFDEYNKTHGLDSLPKAPTN